MKYELMKLPYELSALAPQLSKETLEFHYGKHHQTYVDKLNGLIPGTPHEGKTLEELVVTSDGGVFNNAAQVWNHNFYWKSLSPNAKAKPEGTLGQKIDQAFGGFDGFKKQFNEAATTLFGSGWVWLVQDDSGSLKIVKTSNADNPMQQKLRPLITCDVWEHAYYIDYRNSRPNYMEAYWKLANWEFAESQFKA